MNLYYPPLLILLLAKSLAAGAASAPTPTPPQYDPDSTVCPGSCLGTYTTAAFANGNCFGTVGLCVCQGTLSSPPLGNLTACLEGAACGMSASDTQTYISGLLSFEGCSSSAESTQGDSASSTASGGAGLTGTGTGGSNPHAPAASSKTGGAVTVVHSSPGLFSALPFCAALTGALVGTVLVLH
ncbi:hypothetical protein B0H11DRAFT_644162 [Mycena galericulata]|nr:hypothetical protein B0H11DRAFT_644162 [Mycena galericulata]